MQTIKKLKDSPRTAAAKARFVLATDGVTFKTEVLRPDGTSQVLLNFS